MEKLCLLFVLALIASEAITMSYGHIRGPSDLPSVPIPRRYGYNQQYQPQVTTEATTKGTTTMSPWVKACIDDCIVTAEYNPVCGTNLVTYSNPGRLYCAQFCGVDVQLLRPAPCPRRPRRV